MPAVRYYVALCIVALVPGAFLYWFSIHPFIHFWRRLGARTTLRLHLSAILLLAVTVFLLRRRLLAVDFGSNAVLAALAIPIFAASLVLRVLVAKHLTNRILSGLAELAPAAGASPLLTEGIYARIRHPRYVQILLALLALVLFTNYLATYLVFLLTVLWVVPLTRMEERELRDRFGKPYQDYCARVPRFIPRLRGH
jgi:protein-S-isoprenylcysteine O-methyltransferase Ste14